MGILSVLGDKYGLAGKTPEEKMTVLHLLGDMNDIFGEAQGNKFEDEGRKAKWFSYLEGRLGKSPWLAGTTEPTIADFHGVFSFKWVVKRGVDFSAYPKVTKWWADIKDYPVVAKMYASCV